jgi:hypothetical protein
VSNVDLKLSALQVQLNPGESYQLTVTVINNSQALDTFDLSVTEIEPGWVRLADSEILLYNTSPGNERTTTLTLTVPTNAAPGSYAPLVNVRGRAQLDAIAGQPLLLTVNEIKEASQEIIITPGGQQTTKKYVQARVEVKNFLNQTATIRLYSRVTNNDLQIQLNPQVLTVPAQGQLSSLADLQFRRRNWVGSNRFYDFQVGVEGAQLEAKAVVVQNCTLPWLRFIVITPWLLVMALLLPFVLGVIIAFWTWPTSGNAVIQTTAVCKPQYPARKAFLQMNNDQTDIVVSQTDGRNARTIQRESADRLPGLFSSLLSISPDGRFLAYVTARNEAMDDALIFVINIDTQARQRVASVASGLWVAAPFWSPDNSRLGFVARSGNQLELFEVSVNPVSQRPNSIGTPRELTTDLYYGTPETNGPVCWADDGSRLVLYPRNSQIQYEINLNSRDRTPIQRSRPNQPVLAQSEGRFMQATTTQTPRLAPEGQGDCRVINYSQNDPQWRAIQMGTRPDKIGESGCALTTTAMMFNYFKVDTDPNQLNTCLAEESNPFNWTTAATRCSNSQIQGSSPSNFSWSVLDNILSGGTPAIVGLLGGQTGIHYVVVVGGKDGIAATYRVNDPWDGSNWKSLEYFISQGYRLRWIVNYNQTLQSTCPSRIDTTQRFEPGFTVVSPQDGYLYNQPIRINYILSSNIVPSVTLTTIKPVNAGDTNQAEQTQVQSSITDSFLIDFEGFHTLQFEALDEAGNRYQQTIHFVTDFTVPRLEVVRPRLNDFDPVANPADPLIARGKVTLEFKATDNLSGVALVEYRLNEGAWTSYTNDTLARAITLERVGDYYLEYRAVDGAGNSTEIGSIKFTISTPGTTVTPDPNNPNSTNQPGGGTGTSTSAPGGSGQPATPATPAAPGVLVAAPNALNFDANTQQLQLQLTNTGQGPAEWTLQAPQGPGSNLLKFSATAGTVPPGGSAPLQLSLSGFNLTSSPIQVNFILAYNAGAATLPVVVTIVNQPTPTVQFISPQPGPLTGKSAEIRASVVSTGLAKPDHITFSARFTAQAGGTPAEAVLPGRGTEANGWFTTWDIGSLPPQTGIEISGKICWSVDDSNCVRIAAPIAGLSISKPSYTVTLDPSSDKLGGSVTISAQGTGIIDHITYTAIYKENGVDVNKVLEKAIPGNNFTIKWNTTPIPPQSGIRLDAKVCWTADDNPANCTTPANQLPASFTVDQPVVTINPLSAEAQASLPITLTLSGGVSKVGNNTSVVFVNYKYLPTVGGQQVEKNDPATLSAISNGSGTWTLNIDTSSWPPQAQPVTFLPKICWDGNVAGQYCFPAAAGITGTIPEYVAQFVAPVPTDLSLPTPLKVSGTPANRITNVKYKVKYGTNDFVYLSTVASAANNFSYTFDSVALGLKPAQPVIIQVEACTASGQCGQPNPTGITWTVTDAAINFTPPATTTLAPSVNITGTLTGRGASTVEIQAVYRLIPSQAATLVTTTVGTALTNVPISQTVSVTWDTSAIPPQDNVKLVYITCWGPGELDAKGCTTRDVPGYTALTVPEPVVDRVFINGGSTEYNLSAVLPLPLNVSQPSVVSLPLTATIVGTNVTAVKWRARVQGNTAVPVQQAGTATVSNNRAFKSDIQLDLPALIAGGANISSDIFELTAVPVWTNPTTGVQIEYTGSASVKVLQVKPISFTFSMDVPRNTGGNGSFASQQLVPAPTSPLNPEDKLMVSRVTTFTVNIPPADSGLLNRILFDVTYNSGSSTITTTLSSNLNSPKVITTGVGGPNWTVTWDHTGDLPKIAPQSNITVSWRICTTPSGNDAGCLTSSVNGILNKVTGLSLGGARFTTGGDLQINNPNVFLGSSFNTQAEIVAPTAVKQIRVIAYPTSSTPNPAHRVMLMQRNSEIIKSANDTTWTIPTFWPDDITSVTAFANNVSNNAVTLSLQYCTVADTEPRDNVAVPPLDSVTCSKWDGTDFVQFDSGWKGTYSAKQGVVVVWRPFDNGTQDPYNSYLKFMSGATPNYIRILTVRVYCISGTTCTNPVSFAYFVPSISSSNINIPLTATPTTVSSIVKDYSITWDTNCGTNCNFPVDTDPPTDTRSVTLIAQFNFNVGSSTFPSVTSLRTKGKTSNYVDP